MDNEQDLRASLESAFDSAETTENINVVDEPVISDTDEPISETKAERLRDEGGKFKAKDVTEVTENVAEVTEQPQVKPSPKSLKKELADKHWANLDPELQDALLQRDTDYEKGIEGYKSKAEKAEAFDRALSPYMATIQSLGVQPDVAVTELLKTDHTLRYGNEQQKLAMVQGIFQAYNINPQNLFNYLQNGAPQVNPEIAPVYQELHALRQQQEALLREQQQREQQTLTSEIERAKEGKEHFDTVREDMAALLQANRAKNLDEAYEMAIWARPELRATLLQQERKNAEAEALKAKQQQRSQAAGVSVRGSSPSATTSMPTNLRDMIASQF